MSKRFEKPEDIIREEKAVRLFVDDSDRFVCEKLSPNEIDFLIWDVQSPNEPICALEIKGVKKVPSVDSEHTPIVAIKKLTELQKYINEKKISRVFIAWAYGDGIKYSEIRDLDGDIYWGGQKIPRQGSTNDHELMFKASRTQFKIKRYG